MGRRLPARAHTVAWICPAWPATPACVLVKDGRQQTSDSPPWVCPRRNFEGLLKVQRVLDPSTSQHDGILASRGGTESLHLTRSQDP